MIYIASIQILLFFEDFELLLGCFFSKAFCICEISCVPKNFPCLRYYFKDICYTMLNLELGFVSFVYLRALTLYNYFPEKQNT